MKALAIRERGAAPAVMTVPEPVAGPGEVTVSVQAASINGFDLTVASGRMWDVMAHTFPVALGRDFAGVVTAVGPGVSAPAVGTRVAGNIAGPLGKGGLAEQVVETPERLVTLPDGVSPVQAAAVGLAGITALDLLAALGLEAGETVLVSGATGGVGCLAVQLAAAAGARVLATARPGEAAELMLALGATDVVDHTGDLLAAVRALVPHGVDAVAHAAGDAALLGAALRTGGRLASIVGATPETVRRAEVTTTGVQAKYTPGKLAGLLTQVAEGRLVVTVAATYPLTDAERALADFRGSKLGKIVVTVP